MLKGAAPHNSLVYAGNKLMYTHSFCSKLLEGVLAYTVVIIAIRNIHCKSLLQQDFCSHNTPGVVSLGNMHLPFSVSQHLVV